MNSLIELKKFYEYKRKLLIATEHFIGFNPLISHRLEFPKMPASGEQILNHNFVVGDESFSAKFCCTASSGSIGGYKRLEVYKNEKRIILLEKGNYGYGAHYEKGRNFKVVDGKAYLLKKGIWLKAFEDYLDYGIIDGHSYYLLCFSVVSIPTKFPLRKLKSKFNTTFPSSKKHICSKIKLWQGELNISVEGAIHTIGVNCTTILAVENVLPLINRPRGTVEFTIDGQPYYFENI